MGHQTPKVILHRKTAVILIDIRWSNTFPLRGISSKVNLIARLEFELFCLVAAAQVFSYYTTDTSYEKKSSASL